MSDRRLWLDGGVPGLWRAQRVALPDQPRAAASRRGCCTPRAAGGSARARPARRRPGELCRTPTGRRAARPHTARLHPGRRELFAEEQVWEALERWEAAVALVRFSGGGGSQGSIAAVTLEDAKKRELARWGSRRGRAARGARRADVGPATRCSAAIRASAGLLMWDAQERQVVIAGERGGREVRGAAVRSRGSSTAELSRREPSTARDPSRGSAARRAPAGRLPGEASRSCERCGEPLPAGLRAQARYCSKRCRQAASRARLKDRPPSPPPSPPETCSWCGGPMPGGLRVEARFCSKRCRQASSRHALRVRRRSATTSGPDDTSRARRAPTASARSRNG